MNDKILRYAITGIIAATSAIFTAYVTDNNREKEIKGIATQMLNELSKKAGENQ